MKALILTPWTGLNISDDPNRPLVADAYKLQRWVDVTGQPVLELQPNPNLYAIEAELTADELAKIEADPKFYVVWSDSKKPETKPSTAEFATTKDWLKAQGFSQATLDTALGTIVSNRPRAQIAASLVDQLKKSKKKT